MKEKIKQFLKRILPASRKYEEKKFGALEKRLDKLTEQTRQRNADFAAQLDRIDLKVYRSAKATDHLKEYIQSEFRRRDIWGLKAEEVKRLASGRKIWVIKCPAPDSDAKFRWGDYSFCVTLKRYLERLGYYVIIDCYEDWYCDVQADVILVIRGLYAYHPDRRNQKCRYILWNVSHPETVSAEECEWYDIVYVNAVEYADKLREMVSVPVKTLLLCADTEVFCPSDEKPEYERVFVGNSRGVKRKCVSWCEKYHIPVHVWGNDWEHFVGENPDITLFGPIENEKVAGVYQKAKVVLNDHWDDMKEYGFVNNRILEALCCGSVVITDYSASYEKIFGDALLYYRDECEFTDKIQEAEKYFDTLRQKVRELWPVLQEKYSFAACAKALSEDLKIFEGKTD